jgi:tetratricopeptide (TPR) repeat protein
LYQLGQFYIQQGRFGEARSVVERAVALADHAKEKILRAGAEENIAECCFWTGDLPAAKAYFERALASCGDISRQELIRSYGFDLSILPPLFLGFLELLLGWPERAIQWERRAIERALSSAHPFSQGLGLGIVSLQQCIRADFDAASECIIPVRRICEQYGFLEGSGWALHVEAWNHFWRGEQTLGLAEMNESIRVLRSVGSFNVMALRYTLLAEMQFESGDIEAAETLTKALETLQLTDQGWCEAEIYRIAAKIMLKKGNSDLVAAERYLRRAIETARHQTAKWWELRATTSLASLLRDTNRRAEARELLTEIYSWFTEGFDTADLKDAKALLDELGEDR